MPPKEYNLALDYRFDGLHEHWETYGDHLLTKCMDNLLELLPDYATLFFNAIQASQQPGNGYMIKPSGDRDALPSQVTPATATTYATCHRLALERHSLAYTLNGDTESDEDPVRGASSSAAAQASPGQQDEPVVLQPLMLGDQAFDKIWEDVCKTAPQGNMMTQLKAIRATLLASHNK